MSSTESLIRKWNSIRKGALTITALVFILFAGFWYHVEYTGGTNQTFVNSNWRHLIVGIFVALSYLIIRAILLHVEIRRRIKNVN
ncbi:hypothetical protein [Vibrio alginolyticus]|uniref:hypothetical protein n=1 Tax=Vibrio TaxID=662 RepID=UPI0006CA8BB8|nr:hypothetical protein [Vibrio alginolyticus]KPM97631.1 hypothetical protein AOG25_14310 [Vibrio alginolyticus]CAH7205890.1 conserved hypothetical protein [Vibrio chagasii]CAH7373924.1 conserved hypothetical protein [Vibrio chagasii]